MNFDSFIVSQLFEKLDKIAELLVINNKENKHMSAQMDALVAAVTAENTVIDGVVTLLDSFSTRLAEINANVATITEQLNDALAEDTADDALIADLQAQLAAANEQAVTLQQDVESHTTALATAAATVPTNPAL